MVGYHVKELGVFFRGGDGDAYAFSGEATYDNFPLDKVVDKLLGVTAGEPYEVGLGVIHLESHGAEFFSDAFPFCHNSVCAGKQLVANGEGGAGGGLGGQAGRERDNRFGEVTAGFFRSHEVPHAESGQPVGLGECAQDNQIGVGGQEFQAAGEVLCPVVVVVGLVQCD